MTKYYKIESTHRHGDLFSCGFTNEGSEYKILGTAKVTEVT